MVVDELRNQVIISTVTLVVTAACAVVIVTCYQRLRKTVKPVPTLELPEVVPEVPLAVPVVAEDASVQSEASGPLISVSDDYWECVSTRSEPAIVRLSDLRDDYWDSSIRSEPAIPTAQVLSWDDEACAPIF